MKRSWEPLIIAHHWFQEKPKQQAWMARGTTKRISRTGTTVTMAKPATLTALLLTDDLNLTLQAQSRECARTRVSVRDLEGTLLSSKAPRKTWRKGLEKPDHRPSRNTQALRPSLEWIAYTSTNHSNYSMTGIECLTNKQVIWSGPIHLWETT